MGVTLPSIGSGLSNTDLTGIFIQGSTLSDQALTSSILYGSKSRALLHRCTLGRRGSRGLLYNPSHQATGAGIFYPVRSKRWHRIRHWCALSRTHTRTTECDVSLPQDTTSTIHCHWPRNILRSTERSALTSDTTQSDTAFGLNAASGSFDTTSRNISQYSLKASITTPDSTFPKPLLSQLQFVWL